MNDLPGKSQHVRLSPANGTSFAWLKRELDDTPRSVPTIALGMPHWTLSNFRLSDIFCPRGISSRCSVAVQARERATHSGKCKGRSSETAAMWKCSLRNVSKSPIWNVTVLLALKRSAPSSRAAPRLAVRSSSWTRPARSAANKCCDSFCTFGRTKGASFSPSIRDCMAIDKVNEQVRNGLKGQKLIGEIETVVTALQRLDLTDAQKRDKRFYGPDSVVVFNQQTAGFKAGATGRLLGITEKHLLIQANNRIRPVPFKHVDKLAVCQPKEMALWPGAG